MPKLTAIRKQAVDEMMKAALVEAAVGVLNEHGFDGMTMDRVAAVAEVAKGSLYRYFRGKRKLLEFVYAKTIDPVFQDLEEIVASERPAMEKLEAQLSSLLEHVAKHGQVYKLLFQDDTAHGLLQSSERRTSETASRLLAAIFRQGIAESVFDAKDPLMLAHMYLGLIRGVLRSQPELGERGRREDLCRMLLGTLFNGIATEKGRAG